MATKKGRGEAAGKLPPKPLTFGPAWTWLTDQVLKTGWEHLNTLRAGEMFEYVKGTAERQIVMDMRDLAVAEALSGDQGMMANLLPLLVDKLSKGEALTAGETLATCTILARAVRSPQGVQIACGVSSKRGGTRQGAKSIMVALDVLGALDRGPANSFEEAWAQVAAARNLSESQVKKSWTERKAAVLGVLKLPSNITAERVIAKAVRDGLRSI
jgi:hypothetical protein